MWGVRSSPSRGDFCLSWFRWSTLALILGLMTMWATGLLGQATRGSATKAPGSLIHSPLPPIPDNRVTGPDTAAAFSPADDESCFMWPLTGVRAPTDGLASFKLSGQARKDFQRARKAPNDTRLSKPEEKLPPAPQAPATNPPS